MAQFSFAAMMPEGGLISAHRSVRCHHRDTAAIPICQIGLFADLPAAQL